MSNAQYKLELEDQKRNVFVTQLNQRDDEDDDVVEYPVVKESAQKLIETGLNTLQKTLLLKKEVEVNKVNCDLEAKRHEFRERMEKCAQKQIEVQKKQQRMKDRVAKFEKFIQENEAKRRRAIQKYQTEVKLRGQKLTEYEMLCLLLADLKQRHKKLSSSLGRYKMYEDYLLRVIEAMPEDYIPTTDDKLKGLMMRHRTLSDSNKSLVQNLDGMGDELELLRSQLDELKQEHDKQKFFRNSKLSQLLEEHEHKHDDNDQQEQTYITTRGHLRDKRTELGIITMAIDNIADKCRKSLDRPTDTLTLDEKFTKIKDYLNERSDVAKVSQASVVGSISPEHRRVSSKRKSKVGMNVTMAV